jgi:hypothetical protein
MFDAEKPHAADSTKCITRSSVWSVLAAARHSGLATRLLDWTYSPWVAAYFACVSTNARDIGSDASIIWVEQKPLEEFLHRNWDVWGVPFSNVYYRESTIPHPKGGLGRALEAKAFNSACASWVTKLHFSFPFERMEKQQGCFTICGRILTDQNIALDSMDPEGQLPRGRILIPASIKQEVLRELERFNIRATSLGFPAMDIVAGSLSAVQPASFDRS